MTNVRTTIGDRTAFDSLQILSTGKLFAETDITTLINHAVAKIIFNRNHTGKYELSIIDTDITKKRTEFNKDWVEFSSELLKSFKKSNRLSADNFSLIETALKITFESPTLKVRLFNIFSVDNTIDAFSVPVDNIQLVLTAPASVFSVSAIRLSTTIPLDLVVMRILIDLMFCIDLLNYPSNEITSKFPHVARTLNSSKPFHVVIYTDKPHEEIVKCIHNLSFLNPINLPDPNLYLNYLSRINLGYNNSMHEQQKYNENKYFTIVKTDSDQIPADSPFVKLQSSKTSIGNVGSQVFGPRLSEERLQNTGPLTLGEVARVAYGVQREVTILKTDVAILKTDVDQLKTDVAILKTDVAILKTDVAILKTDVDQLKTDVAILKTDVAILKTDVAILKTDVGQLKTDVKRIEKNLNEFKEETNQKFNKLDRKLNIIMNALLMIIPDEKFKTVIRETLNE